MERRSSLPAWFTDSQDRLASSVAGANAALEGLAQIRARLQKMDDSEAARQAREEEKKDEAEAQEQAAPPSEPCALERVSSAAAACLISLLDPHGLLRLECSSPRLRQLLSRPTLWLERATTRWHLPLTAGPQWRSLCLERETRLLGALSTIRRLSGREPLDNAATRVRIRAALEAAVELSSVPKDSGSRAALEEAGVQALAFGLLLRKDSQRLTELAAAALGNLGLLRPDSPRQVRSALFSFLGSPRAAVQHLAAKHASRALLNMFSSPEQRVLSGMVATAASPSPASPSPARLRRSSSTGVGVGVGAGGASAPPLPDLVWAGRYLSTTGGSQLGEPMLRLRLEPGGGVAGMGSDAHGRFSLQGSWRLAADGLQANFIARHTDDPAMASIAHLAFLAHCSGAPALYGIWERVPKNATNIGLVGEHAGAVVGVFGLSPTTSSSSAFPLASSLEEEAGGEGAGADALSRALADSQCRGGVCQREPPSWHEL